MAFVFSSLILSPTRLASSFILVVLSWVGCLVDKSRTILSAKSKSSSFEVNFHLTALRITQSITIKNKNPDILHPCFTPVHLNVKPLTFFPLSFYSTLEVVMKCSHHFHDLLWDSMFGHDYPQAFSVDRVKSLWKSTKSRCRVASQRWPAQWCSAARRSGLLFLSPSYSFLSLLPTPFLTRSMMILPSTFPTTDSKVIPLEFLHQFEISFLRQLDN